MILREDFQKIEFLTENVKIVPIEYKKGLKWTKGNYGEGSVEILKIYAPVKETNYAAFSYLNAMFFSFVGYIYLSNLLCYLLSNK